MATKLQAPVITDFPQEVKVVTPELNFQNHLEKNFPVRAHHPMPLDLEGLQDPESRQLLILMVDVIYAFQQRVAMAATEVCNMHLGA